MDLLLKQTGGEVVDVDAKSSTVVAYVSAFGNVDSYGDIMLPGCYAESIRARGPLGANRIKVLWQHDVWEPIAVPSEVVEDAVGLKFTFTISKTQRGLDAITLYNDKVITEHSVGISNIVRSENNDAEIERCSLWEGSPVTWGANDRTPVVDLRSLPTRIGRLQKAMSSNLSDETLKDIEFELSVLQLALNEQKAGIDYSSIRDQIAALYAPVESELTRYRINNINATLR